MRLSGEREFLKERLQAGVPCLDISRLGQGVWDKAIVKVIGQAIGGKPQTADRLSEEHLDCNVYRRLLIGCVCSDCGVCSNFAATAHSMVFFFFFWN